MKALFDSIAHRYDIVNTLSTFGLWHRWNNALVKKILKEITPSCKILDLCTGTGEIPFQILSSLQNGEKTFSTTLFEIDCLDFSFLMLAEAEKKLERFKKKSFASISLLEADATAIPKPSAFYDIVIISYGLRNLPLEQSLQEVTRVLKPSGSLFILDLTSPQNSCIRLFHSLFISSFVTSVGILFTKKKEPYTYLKKSIQKFTSKKVTHSLQEVGFTTIISTSFLFGAITLIQAKKG